MGILEKRPENGETYSKFGQASKDGGVFCENS